MVKRAASMKAKHVKKTDLPPIEETFDNAKQAFVNTAEVAVEISKRIDNLINIRKAAYEFWGSSFDDLFISDQCIKYLKSKLEMTTQTYEDILEIVKSFELEEFLKEEMKDYFSDIMPRVDDVETENDLFNAFLVSGIVKPWGEKMTSLHHTMLDEAKARGIIDEEE